MGIFSRSRKPFEPDDAYWQRRWEEDLKGKNIVKRYLVCFGEGHYGDFCGIKEITGYYDKNYKITGYCDKNYDHEEIFYQIDFDNSHNKYIYKPERCFETREQAQAAYNIYVSCHIIPLQIRIDALNAAKAEI